MTERIITLRARAAEGLAKGMCVRSPTGKTVYQVLEVVTLRRAGEIQSPRYRLVLRRLTGAEAAVAVETRNWPADASAPRRPPPAPPTRSPAEIAALIAASRRADRRRPKRVPHYGVDVGPTIRLEAVLGLGGMVLREADVSVATVRDPTAPQRVVRRAVRTDPLLVLQRTGSITSREYEAAEVLRTSLETMTPSLGQSGGNGVHTAPFLRKPISATNLEACGVAREAEAALGDYWEAVLWLCLGGTVSGYSAFRGIRPASAGELVRAGMVKLADHLEDGTCRR
jgi:hypothetical protein